jgi:hypothetical protein
MKPIGINFVSQMGLILLLLYAVLSISSIAAAAPSTTLAAAISAQDIIDGIVQRDRLFSDGKCSFEIMTFRSNHPESFLQHNFNELLYSHGRLSLVRRDPVHDTIERITWDGKRRIGYVTAPRADAEHRYSGTLTADQGHALRIDYWRVPVLGEMPNNIVSVASLVSEGRWELIGHRTIGLYEAWGIRNSEPIAHPNVGNRRYEYWVTPDHNFAPVEFSEVTPGRAGVQEMSAKMENVELGDQAGRWIVTKADMRIHNPNVSVPEAKTTDDICRIVVHDYSTTVSDDSVFGLKFPVGTVVFDDIAQTGLVAGKVVFETREGGRVYLAPIANYPEYDKLTDYGSGLSDAEWQTTQWATELNFNQLHPTTRGTGSPAGATGGPPGSQESGRLPAGGVSIIQSAQAWPWYLAYSAASAAGILCLLAGVKKLRARA